jgi:CelD/BcsL family acetyltransferase involved in cellulose biosynthesis
MKDTETRVISEFNEFESLSEVWDSLIQNSSDNSTVYLTHEWLSTWWKHFGEGKKLNVLLIEKEGRLIGIVPLMRTEYRIGLLKICALETIGSLNCNHIGLMRSGSGEEVVSAFVAYLKEEFTGGKLVLRLTLVPEDCMFFDLLRRDIALPASGLALQEKMKTLAPYIELPPTWDGYFRSLSPNRRHALRRKMRLLQERHTVEFRDCTGDNIESMLSRFIELHEKRWRSSNVRGVFSDPKMEGFYRDIAAQFVKKGWFNFACLIIDGEVASAEYSFIYNQKLYSSTSARNIDYSEYGVGHLHYTFLIKYAIERGLREFDFLKGDEPYKFHWTKSSRRYLNFVVGKRGLYSGLRLRLIRGFLRLYEIRQYSLKEIYYIYLIRRREARQKKEMGLQH